MMEELEEELKQVGGRKERYLIICKTDMLMMRDSSAKNYTLPKTSVGLINVLLLCNKYKVEYVIDD